MQEVVVVENEQAKAVDTTDDSTQEAAPAGSDRGAPAEAQNAGAATEGLAAIGSDLTARAEANPWLLAGGKLAAHAVLSGVLLGLFALRTQTVLLGWVARTVSDGLLRDDPLLRDLGLGRMLGSVAGSAVGLSAGRAIAGGVLAAAVALVLAVGLEAWARKALNPDGLLEAAQHVAGRAVRLHVVGAALCVVAILVPLLGVLLAGAWIGVYAADGARAFSEAPDRERLVGSALYGAAATLGLAMMAAML
ncbi:hypothetical protein JCM13210_03450 [Thermaerobacter litoralis]